MEDLKKIFFICICQAIHELFDNDTACGYEDLKKITSHYAGRFPKCMNNYNHIMETPLKDIVKEIYGKDKE